MDATTTIHNLVNRTDEFAKQIESLWRRMTLLEQQTDRLHSPESELLKEAMEQSHIMLKELQTAQEKLCNNVVLSYEGFVEDVTERKRSEEALLRISKAVDNTSDAISIADLTGTYIYQNKSFKELFEYTVDELNAAGGISLVYCHPTLAHEVFSTIMSEQSWSGDVEMLSRTGRRMQISLRADAIKDSTGQIVGLVEIHTDITERKQAEEALRQSEQRFRAIFENAVIGIGLTDIEGRHIETNPALQKVLGYSNEELCSMSFTEVTYPDDVAADVKLYKELVSGRLDHYQMEKRYTCKNGQLAWGCLTVSLVRGNRNEPQFTVAMVENITERKQAEEKLLHHAFHDVLTDLPNRTLFLNRLDSAIKRNQRCKVYSFAVLFLDLDRFKNINDSLGHLFGDQMLMVIAKKLAASLRKGDTVARLGGDEFAILLEDIKSISDATCIAERIQKELSLPLNLDGYEMFTSVSIGITLSAYGYGNAEDMLRDADTAMYRAKKLGKARYEIFNRAMHESALTLLQLENDLRRAIVTQEFQLHYQPIISLETGRITGFEALVRWQHPGRGMIAPADFIPVAEETGLIVSIGYWVLRSACRQMQDWLRRYSANSPKKISVNLSIKQFSQPDLMQQIAQILQDTGLSGGNLVLEITESVIMENGDEAITLLSQMQALGIELSIDDFGTGYSSLGRLHSFPISGLKIDRCFISPIGADAKKLEIIETIVTLAHKLGVKVTAEGVETAEQLTLLRKLNCEYGQGYFFSRPLDSEAAEALIVANPQW